MTPDKFVTLTKKESSILKEKISLFEHKLVTTELTLDQKLEGGKSGIN